MFRKSVEAYAYIKVIYVLLFSLKRVCVFSLKNSVFSLEP